jgi:hypothetical protein
VSEGPEGPDAVDGSHPGAQGLGAGTRDRARRTISEHGPSTAAVLASRLGLRTAAVRRHLDLFADQVAIEEREPAISYVDVGEDDVTMGHQATVSMIGDDPTSYLMSRGVAEEAAMAMVPGFIESVGSERPMEYAFELNRLFELQMEGAVG